jgi:hypothetical protein
MKTAVEWLVKYLTLHRIELNNNAIQNVINVAKEMEKEQIVKAVDAVQIVHRKYFENGWTGEDILGKEVPTTKDRTYFGLSKNGEQYYNETFKQQEQ